MVKRLKVQETTTDAFAISISSLCLMHCLLAPLVAAALPVFAVIEEAEWLHRLLVLLSAPISALAIVQTRRHFIDPIFVAAALLGLGTLFASAFLERFHQQEQMMTVIGAGLLIFGHVWRWLRHSRHAGE